MLGGMQEFFNASIAVIKLARPAVPSVWPITVLTDPTASFSIVWDGLTLPSFWKKACAIAFASSGSPAGVPVPCA
jgi:hypothetical protein